MGAHGVGQSRTRHPACGWDFPKLPRCGCGEVTLVRGSRSGRCRGRLVPRLPTAGREALAPIPGDQPSPDAQCWAFGDSPKLCFCACLQPRQRSAWNQNPKALRMLVDESSVDFVAQLHLPRPSQ